MSYISAAYLSLMLPVSRVQDKAQQAQRGDMVSLKLPQFTETAACVDR